MKTVSRIAGRISFAFLILSLTAVFFTACSEDETPSADLDEAVLSDAQNDTEIAADFEEVVVIADEATDLTDKDPTARTFEESNRWASACATITRDSDNKLVTIDFGDGCEGPDGKLRSGQIIVEYTKRRILPGSITVITLQNFAINNKKVEGTKTITNLSESLSENIILNTKLEGGKVTWPDGTSATREYDFTRTWKRTPNPIGDQVCVEGGASGMNRAGVSYSVTILEKLEYKRRCRRQGIRIAVAGVKQYQRGDGSPVTIDFGDGDCDRIITVTKDGQSKEIDLSER